MKLKEQLINDLNNKSFSYYPCCSMDFQIIPSFLNFFDTISVEKNFIFIHANNDEISWFMPLEFLEKKLKLTNLEIVEKQTFLFNDEFYTEIAEILVDFETHERENINNYINGIPQKKAIRLELRHGVDNFILYYFCFEAVTTIKYINSLNLNTTDKGLFICAPHNSWAEYETLVDKLISVSNPEYLIYSKDFPSEIKNFEAPHPFLKIEGWNIDYVSKWIFFRKGYRINNLLFEKLVRFFNIKKII
jgi:hypothetical protein